MSDLLRFFGKLGVFKGTLSKSTLKIQNCSKFLILIWNFDYFSPHFDIIGFIFSANSGFSRVPCTKLDSKSKISSKISKISLNLCLSLRAVFKKLVFYLFYIRNLILNRASAFYLVSFLTVCSKFPDFWASRFLIRVSYKKYLVYSLNCIPRYRV